MSRKRLRRDHRAEALATQHVRASESSPTVTDTRDTESYSRPLVRPGVDVVGFDSGIYEDDVLETSGVSSTEQRIRSGCTAGSAASLTRRPATRPSDVAPAEVVRVSASPSMLHAPLCQDGHEPDVSSLPWRAGRRDLPDEDADKPTAPYNLVISHICGIPQLLELRVDFAEPEGTIAAQTTHAISARGFEITKPNSLVVVTSHAVFYGADLAKSLIAHRRLSCGDKVKVHIVGLKLSTQQKHEAASDHVARLMTPIAPERAPFNVISRIRLIAKDERASRRESNPSVITIPEYWPGSQTFNLFVRPCYPVIYDHILESFSGDTRRFVAFTGQPGIGKTMFGWYCLYRLMTEQPDKSIIYVDGEANEFTFIPSVQAPISFAPICYATMQTLAALCEAVCVSDTHVIPRMYDCHGLVLGSPRVYWADHARSRVKRYSPGRVFYFPIPDQAELASMHRLVYPHLSEAGVIRRIAFWGTIPRPVFSEVSDSDQREHADELCDISEDQLLALLNKQYDLSTDPHKASPHQLLHEYALGQHKSTRQTKFKYYRRGLVLPASESLATLSQSLIRKYQHEKIVWLTDIARERGTLSTLHGFLFEYQVLAVLEAGGTFKARRLLSNGATTTCPPDLIDIILPRQPRRQFARGALKAAVAEGHLLVPDHQNHPVCDAFVWDPIRRHHCPINSTVATPHDINGAYLHQSLTELGLWKKPGSGTTSGLMESCKRIPFFWIVPTDIAPEWTVEMPFGTSSESEDGHSAVTELSTSIEQYVVAVSRIDALAAYQRVIKCPRKKIMRIARSLGETD